MLCNAIVSRLYTTYASNLDDIYTQPHEMTEKVKSERKDIK